MPKKQQKGKNTGVQRSKELRAFLW